MASNKKSTISDFTKQRVSEIETQEDFIDYIGRVRLSSGTIEQREAVIEYAKKQHPEFVPVDRVGTEELLKEIEAGQADIPNTDY